MDVCADEVRWHGEKWRSRRCRMSGSTSQFVIPVRSSNCAVSLWLQVCCEQVDEVIASKVMWGVSSVMQSTLGSAGGKPRGERGSEKPKGVGGRCGRPDPSDTYSEFRMLASGDTGV
eukprot:5614727-Amphidinium_carterae.7